MSKIGKSIEINGCPGLEEGEENGETANGYWIPFCSDENVLKLDSDKCSITLWIY
jgi:hypothetical protein